MADRFLLAYRIAFLGGWGWKGKIRALIFYGSHCVISLSIWAPGLKRDSRMGVCYLVGRVILFGFYMSLLKKCEQVGWLWH